MTARVMDSFVSMGMLSPFHSHRGGATIEFPLVGHEQREAAQMDGKSENQIGAEVERVMQELDFWERDARERGEQVVRMDEERLRRKIGGEETNSPFSLVGAVATPRLVARPTRPSS